MVLKKIYVGCYRDDSVNKIRLCVCVCMMYMCSHVSASMWHTSWHVCGNQDNLGCQFLPSIMFETGPPIPHSVCQTSWPSLELPVLTSHHTAGMLGLQVNATVSAFVWVQGNLRSSGPHVHSPLSYLPTSPHPAVQSPLDTDRGH